MSDVVEKTLASLPKILSESLLGGPPSPRKTASRGFQNFIRLVNKARSKQEEEHVIKHELMLLQQQLSQTDVKQECDILCRILYCGILGYDVTFGYIHAIKLAQNSTTIVKRTGYLTSTLLLHEDHELILLLINTIQKDLQSSNILHNIMALNAVCQLVNSEMVPMVLPLVQEKLQHPRELVRVKAATCMHRFVLKTPSLVQHCQNLFKSSLCDKDPGVMSVAVNIYYHLVKRNPENFHSLVPILVNILQQVVSGILPASFEYHSIPLPWLQIQILRTLAILGVNNVELSKQMYSVLSDVLQKTNMKEYMAFGVMYECITAITSIYPDETLLQEAAKCVGRFIRSSDNNLRYIGVKSLTSLVKVRPESALDYQMIVVDLLEDPHYAIQRKTLELLFNMANPVNVQVVCDRLLGHMTRTSNKYWQMDIAGKVAVLAEKFSSSGQLYVDTMIKLLQLNKTSVPHDVVNKIIAAVQKGCVGSQTSQNDTNPLEFKQHLIKKCVECLFIADSSPELVQISAWVVGEFADMLKNMPEDKLISLFIKQFTRTTLDVSTKLWIITSMLKLAHSKVLSSEIIKEKFTDLKRNEENLLIKQKLKELIQFAGARLSFKEKNGTKKSQMDFTLSFLDDFVTNSLERGSSPYKPPYLRKDTVSSSQTSDKKSIFSGLNQTTDKAQSEDSSVPSQINTTGDSLSSSGVSDPSQNTSIQDSGLNLTGVKRRWGKEGFIGEEQDVVPFQIQQQHAESTTSNSLQQKSQEMDKKKELASALFGGISTQQKKFENDETDRSFKSNIGIVNNVDSNLAGFEQDTSVGELAIKPKTDSGDWRKIHNQKSDLGLNSTGLSPLYNPGSSQGGQLDVGTEYLDLNSDQEIPDVENIDFMNFSELNPSSSEKDYFNPVTGNWELDINPDIHTSLSSELLNISAAPKLDSSSDNLMAGGNITENKSFSSPPNE